MVHRLVECCQIIQPLPSGTDGLSCNSMLRPYVYSQEGTSRIAEYLVCLCSLVHTHCMLYCRQPTACMLVAHCTDQHLLYGVLFTGRLPLMEIIFLLERTKVEQNKRIKFQTCYGMPMSGKCRENVQLISTSRHATPSLYLCMFCP